MAQQTQSQFFEQAPLFRKPRKQESERSIQRRIEEYLTNRDIVWSRTDCSHYGNGMPYNHKVTRHGWPDLTACYCGWFLGIEVKSATGVLSEAQKICHGELGEAGAYVVIARGIPDVRKALDYCESNPK